MHRNKDYGTNLRLLASFGGLKVLQLERHTENTPGIHWCCALTGARKFSVLCSSGK